jgi:hypothetical protein
MGELETQISALSWQIDSLVEKKAELVQQVYDLRWEAYPIGSVVEHAGVSYIVRAHDYFLSGSKQKKDGSFSKVCQKLLFLEGKHVPFHFIH